MTDVRTSADDPGEPGARERRLLPWQASMAGPAPTPDTDRTSHVTSLRDRVARADYDPDPRAVAASIIARLLAGTGG